MGMKGLTLYHLKSHLQVPKSLFLQFVVIRCSLFSFSSLKPFIITSFGRSIDLESRLGKTQAWKLTRKVCIRINHVKLSYQRMEVEVYCVHTHNGVVLLEIQAARVALDTLLLLVSLSPKETVEGACMSYCISYRINTENSHHQMKYIGSFILKNQVIMPVGGFNPKFSKYQTT